MLNTYKTGLSVFLPVLNEEDRIFYTLKSFEWCNEIILVDKGSTDRTIEIASRFPNVKIILHEEGEAYTSTEYDTYLKECSYKYSMVVTASDLIHPALAFKIKDLIEDPAFDYDVIKVPYRGYFLGVYEKFSPWFLDSTVKIIKTNLIKIQQGEVHTAYNNKMIEKIYIISALMSDEVYYHLTHESADGVMKRHIRYWRGEATSPEPLNNYLKIVIKKTIRFLFIKQTFFKGKAAIALAFSFLTYYMISYIYKWDHLYGEGNKVYTSLRNENLRLWEKESEKKQ
jgi:glycosyltransferase involved in cell wall biosynthesis